jgi:hypothetical protein
VTAGAAIPLISALPCVIIFPAADAPLAGITGASKNRNDSVTAKIPFNLMNTLPFDFRNPDATS